MNGIYRVHKFDDVDIRMKNYKNVILTFLNNSKPTQN